MDESTRDALVEPLLAALGKEDEVERGSRGLRWKLLWAALVLLALVVLVLKQSF